METHELIMDTDPVFEGKKRSMSKIIITRKTFRYWDIIKSYPTQSSKRKSVLPRVAPFQWFYKNYFQK